MLNSIVEWFAKRNWSDWDMWAAVGQIIGAVATVWTARVALGQMKEARKQNELAIKQMEEARKKEEETKQKELESLKPELTIKANVAVQKLNYKIGIYLTNNKIIPLHVYSYRLINPNSTEYTSPLIFAHYLDHEIEADLYKTLNFGDVATIKIPLFKLLNEIKGYETGLFICEFSTTLGETFTCSIYLKKSIYKHFGYMWEVFVCRGRAKNAEEIDMPEYCIFSIPSDIAFMQVWEYWDEQSKKEKKKFWSDGK